MTPTDKALLTWCKPSNPLCNDPQPFIDGLASETGELFALYKNERRKDGFSWFDCKHCKRIKIEHTNFGTCWDIEDEFRLLSTKYTPKILDKLGDVWYYLRIAYWFYGLKFEDKELKSLKDLQDVKIALRDMSKYSIDIDEELNKDWDMTDYIKVILPNIYSNFLQVLKYVNCSLEELTEMNYQKLNKGDNHE